MQLLLQVLNKEPKTDGIMPAIKIDAATPADVETAFADLLLSTEGGEEGAVDPFVALAHHDGKPSLVPDDIAPDEGFKTLRGSVSMLSLSVETPGQDAPEKAILPSVPVVEVAADLSAKTGKTAVEVAPVEPGKAAPFTPVSEGRATPKVTADPQPVPQTAIPLPGPVSTAAKADPDPRIRPAVAETPVLPATPRAAAPGPEANPIARAPAATPAVPVAPVPPQSEDSPLPTRLPAAEAPLSPRPKTPSAPSTPAPTQDARPITLPPERAAPIPVQARGTTPEAAPPTLPPPREPSAPRAAAAPIQAVLPPDRAPLPKAPRAPRADPAPEVTILVRPTTADAPDPVQMVQTALAAPRDQIMKDAHFGRDLALAKDDGLPPLAPTEASEARRSAEAPAPRLEMPARPVLTQLVQAAKSAIDGMVEVKLSPEELGRVRLAMTTAESGMTVLVTAERPETLDLIRRNIDLFASDLADQGFTDLSFSFGDETARDGEEKPDGAPGASDNSDLRTLFEGRIDTSRITPDGRVDLRL